ncbi:putative leucine-rich repeat receptor-like protein kinase [Gossypium australe]|uniref:non-specific serine/threonine protein kinase n=1 Tax=Gossypium australe TaxID=47621 RepID=A0A5B6WR84_9ROSI|nr:putative leucine-rich repeat receptor-like protein kinase [Gossypium australe]
MTPFSLLLFLLFFAANIAFLSAVTDPHDAATLQSLKDSWQNTPPNWDKSDDPCGAPWEGVTCNSSRVTALDLSFNRDLTGSLSPRLGDLEKLNILILAGCGFTGNIPEELGNLAELSFLALNSNNFTGKIPPSLGKLSKLYWLDLADNQLVGAIPVSTPTSPGLDLLLKAKHFHFNKNKLSGSIPPKLFSSEMVLIHILFDGNQLTGNIPSTLGHVQTLEVLNLAHNNLTGPLPDLTSMNTLNYVDLSNNSFDPTEAPVWFSTLSSLTTLVIEHGSLQGPVPEKLFSFPQIQQVKLRNNAFNGTLNLGDSVGTQLQLVDLQNNQISSITLGSGYSNTLILIGNPVCTTAISNTNFCQIQQQNTKPYSTSLANCGSKSCPIDQKLSPQSCECAYPFEGTLYFRGPMFRELSNVNMFHSLEMSLWVKLGLTPGSVFLQNPFFNVDDYLQIQLALFPSSGEYFNRSEVLRIGFDLSNQTYKPPPEFGPYYFIASPYPFPASHGTSVSKGVIIAVATGAAILVLGLVGVGIYAVRQKKRAEKAIGLSNPFASWAPSGKDSGGAPQLKGARWFSYDELKKCTNNFSESNELGYGGYGKVYKGTLSDGQSVAIKRAQHGSMQGGLEFKTEIELLSRVHHKNLVGLVGFCFDQGEQMLVYEFMANGTLRESLSGRSGIYLDWKRRLRIALGSARGLAYLHELANPPIIHRDIKSTNILLDENLTAKVADFGLSKLVSDSSKGHVSTQVKGTLGYLDPEYYMTQQLTEKSDVYSFGVVMLELITAKQPIEKGKYVVREVRSVMDTKDDEHYGLRELMDTSIRISGNLLGFGKFLELAMQCVEDSATDRPTMSDVVKAIETILQNDGMNTNSTTSASSSATDFGVAKGSLRHPYADAFPKKEVNVSDSDAFDYSGGYTLSAKVEPK